MTSLPLAARRDPQKTQYAQEFWAEYTAKNRRPKYVLGRNVYAADLIRHCAIDAIVDDFTQEQEYFGVPVIRTKDMGEGAMIIAAAGGRPLSVRRQLGQLNVAQIDYFQLRRYGAESLHDIVFNEGFAERYAQNRHRFEAIYQRLADDESKDTFQRLVAFRLDYDLDVMEGFTDRQKEQYFEPFLDLGAPGETFVDVGCFDGFTSLEFARYYPDYAAIHAFEPEPSNHAVCQARLSPLERTTLWDIGLSDAKATLSFSINGSGSGVSEDGELKIRVDRLDDLDVGRPTLIKMDTEGSEISAIQGARRLIAEHAPKLAISAYHKVDDFWRIPECVLAINDQYNIRMRHYTESLYETVLFFTPKSGK